MLGLIPSASQPTWVAHTHNTQDNKIGLLPLLAEEQKCACKSGT